MMKLMITAATVASALIIGSPGVAQNPSGGDYPPDQGGAPASDPNYEPPPPPSDDVGLPPASDSSSESSAPSAPDGDKGLVDPDAARAAATP